MVTIRQEAPIVQYGELSVNALRNTIAHRIQDNARVVDAATGYIFCPEVNHTVPPDLLAGAARIVKESFLPMIGDYPPISRVIGVPDRGKEFAAAVSLATGIPIAVTKRTFGQNGASEHAVQSGYDPQTDMFSISGIPSFTNPGKIATHFIRGLQPGEDQSVLVLDDFMAHGDVAKSYVLGLENKGIKPIFVTMVAKDFPDLAKPQTGFRQLREAGVPAFAIVRFTDIVGGNGGRVVATTENL